jgi:hypothetical protein
MNEPSSSPRPPLLNLKLTRAVEGDPRHGAVETALKNNQKPLWKSSTITVPHLSLTPSLMSCLKALLNRRQLERGLDRIEQLLNNEKKGILALQQKQGTASAHRVSRLLLISNDGSERFYRACEKTLIQHQDRLLLLYLDVSSTQLTESLVGPTDKILKAVLVSDRDAVSAVLFAIIPPSSLKSSS